MVFAEYDPCAHQEGCRIKSGTKISLYYINERFGRVTGNNITSSSNS